MCDNPTLIKNVNFGAKNTGINYYKDCIHKMIYVPCGHCKSCIAIRQMNVVQRMQMEEKYNHLFFCTLTYNDESLPHITTSTGYKIAYADNQDFIKMAKRLRLKNAFGRPFRYYAVTELGSKGGRPHLHAIFMVPKEPGDNFLTAMNLESTMYMAVLQEWRRNYSTNKFKPEYRPLCTYVQKWVFGKLKSTYDLHYIDSKQTDEGIADAAFYVIKYMMKKSTRETRLQQALKLNLPEAEYEEIWKKIKSKHFESENFGQLWEYWYKDGKKVGKTIKRETYEYIQPGIRSENTEYPVFYNTASGRTFPLARYYKRNLLTLDDAEYYYQKRKRKDIPTAYQETEIPEETRAKTNARKLQSHINLQEEGDITTLLFNN